MKKSILILLLTIVSLYGYRDTLYVNLNTGDDNNDGQYKTIQGAYSGPLQTIQQACINSTAGTLIQVAPGDYNRPTGGYVMMFGYGGANAYLSWGMPSTSATYTTLGLSGSPLGEHEYDPNTWVTLAPEYGWRDTTNRTTITGNNFTDGSIYITDQQYIKITGFEFTEAKEGLTIASSMNVLSPDINLMAHHVLIEDNYIHNIGRIFIPCTNNDDYIFYSYGHGNGITSNWATEYIYIRGNVLHDVGRLHPGEYDPRDSTVVSYPHTYLTIVNAYADELEYWRNHDHGLYIHGKNLIVDNNIIFDTESGYNAQIYPGPQSIISNNLFHDPGEVGGNILVDNANESGSANDNRWYTSIVNNIFTGGYSAVGAYNNLRSYVYNNVSDGTVLAGTFTYGDVQKSLNDESQSLTTTIASSDSINVGLVYTLSDTTKALDQGRSTDVTMRDYNSTLIYNNTGFIEGYWYTYAGSTSAYSLYDTDFFGNSRSGTWDSGPKEYDYLSPNNAPYFTSSPNTTTERDSAYTYVVIGADADSDAITYIDSLSPDWLTLTDSTYAGTPDSTDIGANSVVVRITDGTDTTRQAFTIDVWEPTPDSSASVIFDSTPIATADEDSAFVDTIDVLNATNIYADTLPDWLTFVVEEPDSALLQAGQFNGSNRVTMPNMTYTPRTDSLEIELDFKVSVSGDYTFLVADGDTYPNIAFSIGVNSDDQLFRIAGGKYSYQVSGTNYIDGQWHHLKMVVPADSTGLLTIVDGDTLACNNSIINTSTGSATGYARIGALYDGSEALVGEIYDVKVYDGTGGSRSLSYVDSLNGSSAGSWVGSELYSVVSGTAFPNPLHAYLSGTPDYTDLGANNVVLRGTRDDSTATQSYTITVSGDNVPPTLDSIHMYKQSMGVVLLDTTITVNADTMSIAFINDDNLQFKYTFTETDLDADTITTSLVGAPAWLTFASDTLSGIPTAADSIPSVVIIKQIAGSDTVNNYIKVYPLILNP